MDGGSLKGTTSKRVTDQMPKRREDGRTDGCTQMGRKSRGDGSADVVILSRIHDALPIDARRRRETSTLGSLPEKHAKISLQQLTLQYVRASGAGERFLRGSVQFSSVD